MSPEKGCDVIETDVIPRGTVASAMFEGTLKPLEWIALTLNHRGLPARNLWLRLCCLMGTGCLDRCVQGTPLSENSSM